MGNAAMYRRNTADVANDVTQQVFTRYPGNIPSTPFQTKLGLEYVPRPLAGMILCCHHSGHTGNCVDDFLTDVGVNTIDLSTNDIHGDKLQNIPFSQHLLSLDLDYNPIGDIGASYLGMNTSLTLLSCIGCGISSVGLSAICKSNLVGLFLSDNPVTDLSALSTNSTITTLLLSKCNINDDQLPANNRTITDLDITDNRITYKGCAVLTTWSLEALDISYNPICDQGCISLAASTTLRSLIIKGVYCNASEKGLSVLYNKRGLEKLTLSFVRSADEIEPQRLFGPDSDLIRLDFHGQLSSEEIQFLATNTNLDELCNPYIDANKKIMMNNIIINNASIRKRKYKRFQMLLRIILACRRRG